MTVTFNESGIADPGLEFVRGVAAIDVITLRRAAEGAAALGFDMAVPSQVDVTVPELFDQLAVVEVTPLPTVTVTIDTGKMSWGADKADVVRDAFTDYTGDRRYGVTIKGRGILGVFELDGLTLAMVDVQLAADRETDPEGRHVTMWFAEVPMARLNTLGYYGLYALAESLACGVMAGGSELLRCNTVTIPAQQVAWERRMDELLAVNPLLEDAQQRAYMALDETGVRVKVVTAMRLAAALPPGPISWVFGQHHPVVSWLTEPGASVPFAVIATTADAWLDPDASVSFDDRAFGG